MSNVPGANIVVIDTLPAELSYVTGSANIAPDSVTENGDGSTTLIWNVGSYTPNVPIPTITFQAKVGFDVVGGTVAINDASVAALNDAGFDLDTSPLASRTDTRSVTVVNNAAFTIFKEAVTPEIDPGEDIVYDLYLANLSEDTDIPAGSEFIDILPFEGDGAIRDPFDGAGTPPTDYTATPIFKDIQDVDGVGFTFQYTNEDPSTLSNDPATQGSTKWCTSAQIASGEAGCPATDYSDVTAIFITSPAFIAGDPTRRLRLTLNSAGSLGNDIYTNNFKGTPNHVSLGFVPSVDATVRTRDTGTSAPDVLLIKRITAINGNRTANPNDNTPLNLFVDDTTSSLAANDNHANWPASYLLGELNAGLVKPGDEIEYTVYFLNAGGGAAEDVRICDWIQPYQTFVTGLYGGNDIQLDIGGVTYQMTAASDAANTDRAELATVVSLPAGPSCNLPAAATDATDPVVVVDITGTTGDPTGLTIFPDSTGQGTPNNAFGFFRFTTKVDE